MTMSMSPLPVKTRPLVYRGKEATDRERQIMGFAARHFHFDEIESLPHIDVKTREQAPCSRPDQHLGIDAHKFKGS
jgi:hypothetical protein